MPTHSDIIIIGAGPAGLSFAASLAESGLSVTIIERNSLASLWQPAYDGREIALTHASKATMEKLGMWQRIPVNEIYPLRDAKVFDGTSNYSLHFPQPTQARGKPADCLGFLITNSNIRKAAYEAAAALENVTILTDVGVKEAQTAANEARVLLDNGSTLTCRLLIAADSRFSQTRRQIGIAADMHDYGRTMFVVRMKHTLSNNHTAFECFHYGRTLALLPLEENITNTVLTVDNDQAEALRALSPEALAQSVQKQLNNRLGEMEQISEVYAYPLVGMIAQRFHATRSALIGDAAVGMHPVTAHGFNLGLASANILAQLVNKAAQSGKDIGSESLLKQYDSKHMPQARALYHGTNAMLKLFTNEAPPAKLLRGIVLRVSNNLPPLKKWITQQLTG